MGGERGGRLRVEIAYALPDRQELIALEVEEGATVGDVISRSGIVQRFPGMSIVPGQIGVFGRPVNLDAPLRDGDRVEIYRLLIADPKEARRDRAKRAGKKPQR